jgi:hypothetical protein
MAKHRNRKDQTNPVLETITSIITLPFVLLLSLLDN